MPYRVEVLIPQSVLYEVVTGDHSIEEISTVMVDIVKFLDSCEKGEGIILTNLTQLKGIPIKLVEVRNATEPMLRHENYSIMVGYGSSDKVVVNFLANAIAGIFKQPIKLFPSEKEAINFLIARKPSLAESLPEALRRVQNATS